MLRIYYWSLTVIQRYSFENISDHSSLKAPIAVGPCRQPTSVTVCQRFSTRLTLPFMPRLTFPLHSAGCWTRFSDILVLDSTQVNGRSCPQNAAKGGGGAGSRPMRARRTRHSSCDDAPLPPAQLLRIAGLIFELRRFAYAMPCHEASVPAGLSSQGCSVHAVQYVSPGMGGGSSGAAGIVHCTTAHNTLSLPMMWWGQ